MSRTSAREIEAFRRSIRRYYRLHARAFPWRETSDPYAILVSEIMLQQTQTERVVPKYTDFLRRFPAITALADAPVIAVLRAWRGLGYNRRALALKRCAEEVVVRYGGVIPDDRDALKALPGIGNYTAGAIALFAFGRRGVFIETNIRTVFIHSFFSKQRAVRDDDIVPLIEQTLPRTKVREWYYALMDYGVMLKRTVPGITQRSAHYIKQTPFRGSRREIRGAILRLLTERAGCTRGAIKNAVRCDGVVLGGVLKELSQEGFITFSRGMYRCRR